jgi:eukaryotic-like serine/threonine-protein kinase
MSEAGHATAQKSGTPDPLIGRVIADRFKVTSLIARGGMGKVYRAEQSPLGRLCAVKVLNPNYNGDADPEFHRRFFREASITSRITHPNSVTIFDYGKTDDDIYFMAMEYLEGQTLHMALREGGVMHEVRAGRIASQICRALREAHKLGVIHRDLKPANIFLTRPNTRPRSASGTIPPASEEDEDFVKVLDFGLVKHLSERPEEQLTQTGLFMGSPKYMAPEQIQGGHVDERTDIYSLGIIMYEMLAGKVPFERASSVNILMAHVGEPPPPMRAVNPNLVCSPVFEELVMSCIAKDPNQRYSSMDHVLQAIRRAHGGSQTGQVAAISGTGPYLRGSTPPPLTNHTPPYGGPVSVSMPVRQEARVQTHTPSIGILRADASNDIGTDAYERKPRSKIWVLLGVFVAAVVGGGLGMLAFRYTTPPVRPVASTSAPSAASAASAASTASVSASVAPTASVEASSSNPTATTSPPIATATGFKVTTDPAGASIREDNKELCAATPCDIVFKGDVPDRKVHKLVIARAGFKPETRSVKAGDAPLHVKLAHAGGGGIARPPSTTPKSDPTTTPSGFKDQPY